MELDRADGSVVIYLRRRADGDRILGLLLLLQGWPSRGLTRARLHIETDRGVLVELRLSPATGETVVPGKKGTDVRDRVSGGNLPSCSLNWS